MSKAEEKAYEAYPVSFYEGTTIDVNELPREVFIEGYHQAEKDLELTWEDIERIDDISIRLDGTEEAREISNKEFYQEVLERFKALKGK